MVLAARTFDEVATGYDVSLRQSCWLLGLDSPIMI